jgi:signal transduction histidine kinase/ligand-binding sensor domain-containing protein/DNA-binding response OmpR family regulator
MSLPLKILSGISFKYPTSLLALLILFVLKINAQELQFKSISVNDGLSQHDVSCIIQDSYGFMWIGTYDGLNRYDGYRILNFFHVTGDAESLSSNRILCLYEDSKKRIWIGTDGAGINYYLMVEERFVRINTPEGYKTIRDFVETKNGKILVATNNGVLQINDENNNINAEIMQLPVNGLDVRKIKRTDTKILFTTSNGIWQLFSNGEIQQIQVTQGKYYFKSFVLGNNILAHFENKLQLITENKNTYAVHEIKELENNVIRDFALSEQGEIWIGTLNNGLYSIDTTDYRVIENITVSPNQERGILSNAVLCLYRDKSNILWVGNRQGLCFANLSPKKFNTISLNWNKSIPKHPHVRTLVLDSTNLYFSLQNEGLFRYSLLKGTVNKLLGMNDNATLVLKKMGGRVFAGTDNGLYVKDEKSENFSPKPIIINDGTVLNPSIFAICADNFGNKYYGTFSGLIIEEKNNGYWLHEKYPQTEIFRNKRVFSLYYDQAINCVWVGTISDGLYKINLSDKGEFLSLEVFHSSLQGNYNLVNNTIWCFHKSNDNTFWIGTDAGLLKKPGNASNFSQIKTDGILDKKIMGILEDKNGNLWLSNSQGLIRYTPGKEEVRRFTHSDGLSSSTFTEAVELAEDGTMYFGNINGINYFKPEEIKNSSYAPTIAIADFKVHNKSVLADKKYFGRQILSKSINLTKNITLNHKQNNFSFEFIGANYANTSETRFRYKLENYDSDWFYTGSAHRFAEYSNLKPGSYIFCVEAANQDGIWSGNIKEFEIKILPAPWFSLWAYLLYSVLVLGILFLFIYFLHNRQKLRHELELEHFRYIQDKKINELKLSFFTDVAHEFKTPLSLIIGPINDLIQNKLGNKHRDFCYQVVSRNTKRMMLLVDQLLDFRKINANRNIIKISESDLPDFIHQTTKAFRWQAKNENINFNIITPDKLKCFFDRDIIEKVVYNLLSNAFKFTPSNGIVEIELKSIWKEGNQLANIIIKDSGKGIPNDEKEKIFERFFHGKDNYSSGIGLHLSYTLIKAHKGEINVSDSKFGGTEFIVSFPISKHSYNENEFLKREERKSLPEGILAEIKSEKNEVVKERENILIVEDDHDLRVYLKNILHARYNVFEAPNGLKGLNIAIQKIPDIVVTDVMMPEMDGIEMCRKLRSRKETSHIPILMLTAKTAQEQQNEGLDAGAWDYINKPFDTHALLSKINNILEARNIFRESMRDQNINIEVKKHYTSFDQQLIAKATKVVYEHINEEDFSIENLSQAVGLSRMQFHRKLKSLAGLSATEFVNNIKIQYAKKMFDKGCDRINEAMDAVGINSYSHFNKMFVKIVGISASDYIKKRHSKDGKIS